MTMRKDERLVFWMTTQKNDRWWWTKESIKSRRSDSRQELNYLRLQTRPLSIPAINASSPSSWSETKKEYRKSLLCFIMTVWFTQNFIECPKKELDLLRPNRSLKEGVSPTPPTIADSHTRPRTGCFLALLSPFLEPKWKWLLANKSCFSMKFFI